MHWPFVSFHGKIVKELGVSNRTLSSKPCGRRVLIFVEIKKRVVWLKYGELVARDLASQVRFCLGNA